MTSEERGKRSMAAALAFLAEIRGIVVDDEGPDAPGADEAEHIIQLGITVLAGVAAGHGVDVASMLHNVADVASRHADTRTRLAS